MIIKPQKFNIVGNVKAGKPIKFATRVFRKANKFCLEKYLLSASKSDIFGGKIGVVGATITSNSSVNFRYLFLKIPRLCHAAT